MKAPQKMIEDARSNLEKARQALTYWEQVVSALEGKTLNDIDLKEGSVLIAPKVSPRETSLSDKIRAVYSQIDGEFDKNYVMSVLEKKWPDSSFDNKFVSTALGKDAKRGKLVTVHGRVSNKLAIYRKAT